MCDSLTVLVARGANLFHVLFRGVSQYGFFARGGPGGSNLLHDVVHVRFVDCFGCPRQPGGANLFHVLFRGVSQRDCFARGGPGGSNLLHEWQPV